MMSSMQRRLNLAAACVCLAGVMPGAAMAESVSAARHAALQERPLVREVEASLRAEDWASVYQRIEAMGAEIPANAEQELVAYRLATGLQAAPMAESGRRWLRAVALWPVVTTEALPDAGHGIQVPAFPATHAARTALRVWQARDDAQRLREAISTSQWPGTLSPNGELLARLGDAEYDALYALWPSKRQMPADWALRWASSRPDAERVERWLWAESQTDTPSAQRRQRGFASLASAGDAAVFDQLAAAVRAHPDWTPLWLAALGELSSLEARRELRWWAGDPQFGLDALQAQARSESGREWIREQIVARGDQAPEQVLRRMLIVLVHAGEEAFLRDWAAQPSSPRPLKTEVLAWLGD